MGKLDKKQTDYIARTIMPELYKCQMIADASLENLIRRYFGDSSSDKELAVSKGLEADENGEKETA